MQPGARRFRSRVISGNSVNIIDPAAESFLALLAHSAGLGGGYESSANGELRRGPGDLFKIAQKSRPRRRMLIQGGVSCQDGLDSRTIGDAGLAEILRIVIRSRVGNVERASVEGVPCQRFTSIGR
jgi:hypothetical protein